MAANPGRPEHETPRGRRRETKPRETGTAGAKGEEPRPAATLPPDPQELGEPMTADERVDEASLESMDASDPPAYTASHSGGPAGATSPPSADDSEDTAVRTRARALWEAAGRPEGRDREFWEQAQKEVREAAREPG